MANLAPIYPANMEIPIDLFVSKKHPGLPRGELGFADASGNIIFKVNPKSSKSSDNKRLLLDAAGKPLISIHHKDSGSWEGFSGEEGKEKDLILRVERTLNKLRRKEFEVFVVGENWEDSTSNFKVKGCPFQRSCTIYIGDSIVAQTSLMYKLRTIFVGKSRFRLTIFPGFPDHALLCALIVIFFDGHI